MSTRSSGYRDLSREPVIWLNRGRGDEGGYSNIETDGLERMPTVGAAWLGALAVAQGTREIFVRQIKAVYSVADIIPVPRLLWPPKSGDAPMEVVEVSRSEFARRAALGNRLPGER